MKPTWDEYFFAIAEVVSTRATCLRLKVGTVIVKDGQILATGYNGAESGAPECIEVGCKLEHGHCVRTLHSEENAITFAAKHGVSIQGATVYCTHKPCFRCERRLKQAGIAEIKWNEEYESNHSGEQKVSERTPSSTSH